jgi:von Willebrand factor type A domain
MANKVYFLLDRSGSMDSLWKEALGSINAYVENIPKDTEIELVVFDSSSYDVIRNTTAGNWVNLTDADALPRASTPLYDAAGRLMHHMLHENKERAILVTMTDGFENASKSFNQTQIKDLIRQVEAKRWETIFLGANFEKVTESAQSVGVPSFKGLGIKTSELDLTMRTMVATSTMDYFATGAAVNYSDEDKARALGK